MPTRQKEVKGESFTWKSKSKSLRSDVHLLEIDLLRQGELTVALPPNALAELPNHHYRIVLSRANQRNKREVWTVHLRKRLPRISAPLLSPDPDVVVDLQAFFDHCYDNGAYARFVRYDHDPPLPLHPNDLAWVRKVLKQHRRLKHDASI